MARPGMMEHTARSTLFIIHAASDLASSVFFFLTSFSDNPFVENLIIIKIRCKEK